MQANYFKAKREAKGLTQQKIADALSIKTTAVSAWERGIACPDIDHVPTLSKLYGVPESNLIRAISVSRGVRRAARQRVPA